MLPRPMFILALLVGGACAERTRPQVSPSETTTSSAPALPSDEAEPTPAAARRVDAAIEELERLLASPELDLEPDHEGRRGQAVCRQLGELRDPSAVPVLLRVLAQPTDLQPVAVHRAAVDALGHIRDPRAVDALLSVAFRVADVPTTTNIGARAKLALARIGEPAVPATLKMLRGEHPEVMKYARQNGVPQMVVTQVSAVTLGAIGSSSAVPDLLEAMPTCGGDQKALDEHARTEQGAARAVIANALGFLGDDRAVEPLCRCAMASGNPGDMFPIIESLGRIGGPSAAACLADVVRRGKYRRDIVQADFELEPRWDAARFAVLALAPHDLRTVKKAMASNRNAKVKAKLKGWSEGIDLVVSCSEDRDCYLQTLTDASADWFARETAAFAIAKLSPGDVEMAEAIAGAFDVRNPDARVSMAWLPARMLAGKKCQGCAEALQATLDAEHSKLPVQYQLSALVARNTVARLEEPG